MDQLAAMRSFVQAVDKGGFAAAARRLGLSGPMVGNHVRFLEAQLGGALLHRTTRSQRLTELGRAYLIRCRRILAEIDAAEADAAELLDTPRGLLRVTAPHSIGMTILPAVIADFLHAYPAVDVDLHLDDARIDILAEGFDLAVRVGSLSDANLVTRSLAPLELVVGAAPDYLSRRGEPMTLADLAAHDCFDFTPSSTPGVWRFQTADGTLDAVVSGRLRANSGFALRAAALAGLGIIMQPKVLLRDDIDAGRLVALLRDFRPQSRPIQLLMFPGRQPTPKIRRFVDLLVAHLGATIKA